MNNKEKKRSTHKNNPIDIFFIKRECPSYDGGRCLRIEDFIPSCPIPKSRERCCLICDNNDCKYYKKCNESIYLNKIYVNKKTIVW